MSRVIRLVTILVFLAVAAAACSGGGGEEAEPEEPTEVPTPTLSNELPPTPTPEPIPDNAIKVGVLMDTGGQDADGVDAGNLMSVLDRAPSVAFEAQIEAINEAGGVLGRPVSVLRTDTTSRLSVVDEAAREMIDAGAELLVVTCEFDFAAPAIQRAEEAGVLVMSPCASEEGWTTGDAGELAFSMVPPVATFGEAMAQHMWAQGHRNVAVISDRSAPEARIECDSFEAAWRELGGTIQHSQAFSLRAADRLAENQDIRSAAAADAVAFCAFAIIGEKLMGGDDGASGIRSMGIDAPIVAGPSFDTGTWLPLDFVGLGDFELLALASVHGDDPSPDVEPAIEGFVSFDSARPASGRFVLGADLADIWAGAVEMAGTTDGASVARQIRQLAAYDTVSGLVTFGGLQAPDTRQLRVLRHQNGTLRFDKLLDADQAVAE